MVCEFHIWSQVLFGLAVVNSTYGRSKQSFKTTLGIFSGGSIIDDLHECSVCDYNVYANSGTIIK